MNVALILSGGCGLRMETEVPKQYIEVKRRPVIDYCLSTFLSHPMIDVVIVVAAVEWHSYIRRLINRSEYCAKFKDFVLPGENRQLSVFHGLERLMSWQEEMKTQWEKKDSIIIHDAARPGVSADLITRCLEAIKEHEGVLPVMPMKDTLYYCKNGKKVDSLLERDCIFAGQAPETFRILQYYQANVALLPEKIKKIRGSTEPAVIAGMDVSLIPGEEKNYKLTTIEDLYRFQKELIVTGEKM